MGLQVQKTVISYTHTHTHDVWLEWNIKCNLQWDYCTLPLLWHWQIPNQCRPERLLGSDSQQTCFFKPWKHENDDHENTRADNGK